MFLREARRVAALICLIISVVAQEKNPADEIRKLKVSDEVYFIETFNDKDLFLKKWSASSAKKEVNDGSVMKYEGDWIIDSANKDPLPDDLGLTFKEKAKHRAISVKLKKEFTFKERPLILQYEVLHQEGQECGGAYLKLISNERLVASLSNFNDKTPYTIMFGPDKCGNQHKLHFIFRHKNPVTGTFEEKHCKQPKSRIDEVFTDGKPHLFKLLLTPDNAYKIFVDNNLVNSGSLLEDFTPPVNPPAEIDDPADLKPADWDDKEKIPDPSAKKPEDWDEEAPFQIADPAAVRPDDWLENEPENIRDPSAVKPDDWEDEMDGEWEAPLVPNPACEGVAGCGPWSAPLINNPSYKGVWSPPLIDNPNYKGQWKPKKIHNPNYFEDKQPFAMTSIDALGFELWSMSAGILFDNIILTHSNEIAQKFAALTYNMKMQFIEKSSDTFLNKFIAFTNEYPWLWALYVVILLIPVTLIVVCCFWTRKDTVEDPKKNDDFGENVEDYSEIRLIPDSADKPTKEEAPKENDLLNLDVSDLPENEKNIEEQKSKKSNDEPESSPANLSADDKVEADNPTAESTDVNIEKGESSSGDGEEDDEDLEEVTEVGSTIRKRK